MREGSRRVSWLKVAPTAVSPRQAIMATTFNKDSTYRVVKLELTLSLVKSGSVHAAKRLSVRLSTRRCGMLHTSFGMRVNQLLVRSLCETHSTRSVRGQEISEDLTLTPWDIALAYRYSMLDVSNCTGSS